MIFFLDPRSDKNPLLCEILLHQIKFSMKNRLSVYTKQQPVVNLQ